jgi:DNA polymerase
MTAVDDNSVSTLAEALSHRILWEMENGVVGYSPFTAEPLTTLLPIPAPPLTSVAPGATAPLDAGATPEDPAVALDALKTAIGECTRCGLSRGRTQVVFGEGNPYSELVFVGEGPGRDEDLKGRPFVGEAGQLLTRIIEAMGLSREKVYICNVVKCRPPNNRTPEESETNICGPFVRRQIAVIRPKVIVALGATAASFLLHSNQPISRLRGTFHKVEGIPIMPTFHPAYLLRNPSEKRAVWSDMQMVMDFLGLKKPSQ